MGLVKLFEDNQDRFVEYLDELPKDSKVESAVDFIEILGFVLFPFLIIAWYAVTVETESIVFMISAGLILVIGFIAWQFISGATSQLMRLRRGRECLTRQRLKKVNNWLIKFPQLSEHIQSDISDLTNNDYDSLRDEFKKLKRSRLNKNISNIKKASVKVL